MPESKQLKWDEEKCQATIGLTNVRLSYPYLNQPRPKKEGDANKKDRWEASLIIDHTGGSPFAANLALLKEGLALIRKTAFKGREVPHVVHSNKKKLGKEGHEDEKGFYLTAPSYGRKPSIRDSHKTPLDNAPDTMFYPGARVNAVIRFYAQKGNKDGMQDRIACSLEGIMFYDHDKRIDSRGEADFDAYFDVHEVQNEPPEGNLDSVSSSTSKAIDDDAKNFLDEDDDGEEEFPL